MEVFILSSFFLFDLDGTLLDTAPDLANAVNFVLEKYGKPTQPLPVLRTRVYGGSKTLLSHAFQLSEHSSKFEKIRDEFLQHYHAHLTDETTLFPGMEDLLQLLESKKYSWGVVTNKPTWLTTPLLSHFNLLNRAACVVCGDTLKTAKPDPAPLLHAAELIKQDPKQGIFLGDSEMDMQAAKSAGMLAVLAQYGYLPDNEAHKKWPYQHTIRKPMELLEIAFHKKY